MRGHKCKMPGVNGNIIKSRRGVGGEGEEEQSKETFSW